MQATAIPVVVIATRHSRCEPRRRHVRIGRRRHGEPLDDRLIVALDAYGPVTDKAGGIAEMAELTRKCARITDPPRRRRPTREGCTKGYAIGSARSLRSSLLGSTPTDQRAGWGHTAAATPHVRLSNAWGGSRAS